MSQVSKVRLPATASFFIFFPQFSHHKLEARCSEHDDTNPNPNVAEFINTALESLSSSSPLILKSIAIHITK